MARHNSRSPLRLTAGALAALVVVACAPAAARASCGDHVHIGQGAAPRSTPPAHPATPCRGPNCSQHPDQPAPVPPQVLVKAGDDLARTVTVPALLPGSERFGCWAKPPSTSAPLVRSIFHPPRGRRA